MSLPYAHGRLEPRPGLFDNGEVAAWRFGRQAGVKGLGRGRRFGAGRGRNAAAAGEFILCAVMWRWRQASPAPLRRRSHAPAQVVPLEGDF